MRNSTQTESKTAAQAYAERAANIAKLLKTLTGQLEDFGKEAAADPRNWGFVGSLGEVEEKLTYLTNFIAGKDA